MDVILWVVLGAVAGWIASIVMKTDSQQGLFMDVVVGIIGGLLGGFLMNLIGQPGVSGFNLYSLLVAVLGAVVLIWLRRAVYR